MRFGVRHGKFIVRIAPHLQDIEGDFGGGGCCVGEGGGDQ